LGLELTTLVVIDTDCTGSCISSYHMTMTALVNKIEINVKQIFEYQILHFDKLTR
jgi:hypothetical protein